ncbi:hypothetical protein SEA_PHREDRICK_228 [Streptomyces phage Phredrick]|nr:hypothetical protein SEA_KENREY_229 [Streptomyces phage Kenrey]WNN94782.1 hypothetical protein SEA_PHREDRICK_228 [Streptomyces phage Phredrick]
MAIVRISTVLKNAPSVGIQACVYGVECETIESKDPAGIVFELMGSKEKIANVVGRTGSRILSIAEPVGK